MEQKAAIGRIVHFVMPDGEHRPAIIVKVWDPDSGTSNLQVFTDSGNDGLTNVAWRTSVQRSEEPQPHYWHWPERE